MWQETISYIFNFLLGVVVTALWTRLVSLRKENRAILESVRSLLRQKIIEMYNRFIVLGYIPIAERESLYDLAKNYEILKGDRVIADLMEVLKKLTTGPEQIKNGDE